MIFINNFSSIINIRSLMSYMKIKKIDIQRKDDFVCLMVFNATFKNISAISWRSVLLVEETG
jgi:hypothetical protein